MNNLPTAEEFLNNTQEGNSTWGDLLKNDEDVFYEKDVKIAMIEFAKLHVKAALKSCQETCKSKFYAGETGYLKQEDVELAYPLDNIK